MKLESEDMKALGGGYLMSDDKKIMNGYYFADSQMAKQAKKECQAIVYLQKQIDFNHPERVLQLYQQAISQELFQTQVGYDYLHQLQQRLLNCSEIDSSQIVAIPVSSSNNDISENVLSNLVPAKDYKKQQQLTQKYRSHFQITLAMTIILAISVASMFLLVLSSNLPTILNYQTKLIDKYSAWEEELQEKEDALNVREAELEKLEAEN